MMAHWTFVAVPSIGFLDKGRPMMSRGVRVVTSADALTIMVFRSRSGECM